MTRHYQYRRLLALVWLLQSIAAVQGRRRSGLWGIVKGAPSPAPTSSSLPAAAPTSKKKKVKKVKKRKKDKEDEYPSSSDDKSSLLKNDDDDDGESHRHKSKKPKVKLVKKRRKTKATGAADDSWQDNDDDMLPDEPSLPTAVRVTDEEEEKPSRPESKKHKVVKKKRRKTTHTETVAPKEDTSSTCLEQDKDSAAFTAVETEKETDETKNVDTPHKSRKHKVIKKRRRKTMAATTTTTTTTTTKEESYGESSLPIVKRVTFNEDEVTAQKKKTRVKKVRKHVSQTLSPPRASEKSSAPPTLLTDDSAHEHAEKKKPKVKKVKKRKVAKPTSSLVDEKKESVGKEDKDDETAPIESATTAVNASKKTHKVKKVKKRKTHKPPLAKIATATQSTLARDDKGTLEMVLNSTMTLSEQDESTTSSVINVTGTLLEDTQDSETVSNATHSISADIEPANEEVISNVTGTILETQIDDVEPASEEDVGNVTSTMLETQNELDESIPSAEDATVINETAPLESTVNETIEDGEPVDSSGSSTAAQETPNKTDIEAKKDGNSPYTPQSQRHSFYEDTDTDYGDYLGLTDESDSSDDSDSDNMEKVKNESSTVHAVEKEGLHSEEDSAAELKNETNVGSDFAGEENDESEADEPAKTPSDIYEASEASSSIDKESSTPALGTDGGEKEDLVEEERDADGEIKTEKDELVVSQSPVEDDAQGTEASPGVLEAGSEGTGIIQPEELAPEEVESSSDEKPVTNNDVDIDGDEQGDSSARISNTTGESIGEDDVQTQNKDESTESSVLSTESEAAAPEKMNEDVSDSDESSGEADETSDGGDKVPVTPMDSGELVEKKVSGSGDDEAAAAVDDDGDEDDDETSDSDSEGAREASEPPVDGEPTQKEDSDSEESSDEDDDDTGDGDDNATARDSGSATPKQELAAENANDVAPESTDSSDGDESSDEGDEKGEKDENCEADSGKDEEIEDDTPKEHVSAQPQEEGEDDSKLDDTEESESDSEDGEELGKQTGAIVSPESIDDADGVSMEGVKGGAGTGDLLIAKNEVDAVSTETNQTETIVEPIGAESNHSAVLDTEECNTTVPEIISSAVAGNTTEINVDSATPTDQVGAIGEETEESVRPKVNLNELASSMDTKDDIYVSVVTWNLAEESPEEEDASFIKKFRKNGVDSKGSDFVLISGQECENIKPRRTEGRRSRELRRLMVKLLGKRYVPIAIHQLGGIQFGLFCRRSILGDVQKISVADVTCGIGNVFHNKGAIAAFVQLKARNKDEESQSKAKTLKMLFVTAHLAAHVKDSEARDADFWRIMTELEAQAPSSFVNPSGGDENSGGTKLLDAADRLFFCGDLNYRLDLPREITEYSVQKIEEYSAKGDAKSVELANKQRSALLRHDQLRATMAARRAFIGLAEGPIAFAPTFKYDKNSDDFDTSHKQRIPAWTDRVLFKPFGTRVVEYKSVPEAQHSDHRPVFATFRVNTEGRPQPSKTTRKRPKKPKPSRTKKSQASQKASKKAKLKSKTKAKAKKGMQ